MKTFLTILFSVISFVGFSQSLHINSTRFIGGDTICGTEINYAIPTKDKGLLFTGFTECLGSTSGDIPSNPIDTSASHPGRNLIVGKIDSNRNLSWIKVYGGSWEDDGNSICEAKDSGYAILGFTKSNDRDVSGNHAVGAGGDLWLLRLNNQGDLLWQKCFGSPGDEEPGSIALARDGGFIMFGESNSSGGDVPFHYGSGFVEDWFVVKTDSVGNKQWSKTFGGTSYESLNGSIITAGNAFYLVSASGSIDHDCIDTSWHAASTNTNGDVFILKIDTAGNRIWSKSFGSSASDFANNAIWDNSDSTIVLAGGTYGNDYMVHGYHDKGDMLVMKIDTGGHLKWSSCLGDITKDEATGIIKGPNNGYLVYGSIFPNPDSIHGNLGQQDNWLFLTDSTGNPIANKIFGGSDYETPTSIVQFNNKYIATGITGSNRFTEGTNTGKVTLGGSAFISLIELWSLGVINVLDTQKHELIVYPNPNNGKMNIIFPSYESAILIITDIKGREVYKEQTINVSNRELDIRGWSKGTYNIIWINKGSILTKKAVII